MESLSGTRSNLCLADIGSATRYLETGSVEVYFSFNRAKKPTVPRIAIAKNADGAVYEVRGTFNKSEDIDPFMEETDKLAEQLKDVPNGEEFLIKDRAMKRMTVLYKKCFKVDKKTNQKTFLNPALNKNDLRFLYEFDGEIEGFGYQRDPRIDELRSERNRRADLCTIFNCTLEELDKKEHVTLKNIPQWKKLPAEAAINKDLKFDAIWSAEYKKDRLMADFRLLSSDAEKISLERTLTGSLAKSLDAAKGKESQPDAKVFEIGDVIRKKKKENPNHSDYLTTKEVLEAIDEAGYRPAMFAELLAFGRDSWKPEVDPKNLTEEERVLQNVQAPFIYALGSPFSYSGGDRFVPDLFWVVGQRELFARDFDGDWAVGARFLVLRNPASRERRGL